MSVADRVLAALGPGIASRAGDLLRPFVEGITAPLDDVDELVTGEDGWTGAFNLDTTDQPGWLGQLAGVAPAAGTVEQQRAAVRSRGYSRGTVAAIRAAAQATLTGTKRVTVTERADGAAYRLEITTYAAETPDKTVTEAAVRAVKPAGLILAYDAPLGQTYRDVKTTGQTYQQIKDFGLTYDQFRKVVPNG